MQPRQIANIAAGALLAAYCAALAVASASPDAGPTRIGTAMSFDLCVEKQSANCVIDGDTIRWDGMTIRLADIDAPEIFSFKCAAERQLGEMATQRLRDLLNSRPVLIETAGSRDEDRYGRKLRLVGDASASFGNILVTEGLARPWDGSRHGWCA